MADLPDVLKRRIAQLAADRESGASRILEEVIELCREGRSRNVDRVALARAVCEAQPSMAPVWRAALEFLADRDEPGRFERFAERVAHASRGLARTAITTLVHDRPGAADAEAPLHLVTISASGAVRTVIDAVRPHVRVRVSCGEARPALEGRAFAAWCASSGVAVTVFADAALATALDDSDAVVVGADAITPTFFVNKAGTRMLAAAASWQGVPVYVAATREKFVSPDLAAHLVLRDADTAEVWSGPPEGVTVRNPYFEGTPLDLVAGVMSDAGLLGTGMVPDVCRAQHDPPLQDALRELTRSTS